MRGGSVGTAVVGAVRAAAQRVHVPARRKRPLPGVPPPPGRPAYRGDFTGTARIDYAPDPDGDADPGEVVWAWVPFEEDHSRGKDRPVLVVSREGVSLLGLMLSSRDHDENLRREARRGRLWMDVGPGGWDPEGRPSEVRLDRVVRLDPTAVRREGATLPRPRFDAVADRLRDLHGWV